MVALWNSSNNSNNSKIIHNNWNNSNVKVAWSYYSLGQRLSSKNLFIFFKTHQSQHVYEDHLHLQAHVEMFTAIKVARDFVVLINPMTQWHIEIRSLLIALIKFKIFTGFPAENVPDNRQTIETSARISSESQRTQIAVN